jgi:hypothetical protein
VSVSELKAAGFNSAVAASRELVGDAAFDQFVAKLPPQLSDYILRPRLATTWIPFADFVTIAERLLSDLFRGDLERAFEVGRRQFKNDLSTVYKIFVRAGSVNYLAKRCAVVYGTYTKNCGTMRVVREDDHLIEADVIDHPFGRPALWQYLRGNVHAAAEASGARSVKTAIVSESDRNCRYRLTWI